MLGDGLANSGTQGSYFRYQYASLKLLEQIANSIAALPGVDYEARTTRFEVIAGPTPPGAGYSIGDFLVRYDIINVNTGAISVTVWFNQTLQTTLVGAGNPNPADLTPVDASMSVTVLNPFNLEATQLAVLAALGPLATEATLSSILGQLDVALSTRASEATLATRASEATVASILAQLDVALSTRASAANQTTLGAQTTKINDGTNTAAVKAASTAPLATDPALVVTISPNSTVGITTSSISTNTSVARATTVGGVTLLAANANRKGATITNDSGAIMYVLFAVTGTVSSTVYTVRLGANDYYEVPFGYTGAISGIWASAGAGNALMSELT